MSTSSKRRDLLKLIGGAAGAGAATKLLFATPQTAPPANGKPSMRTLPWPYKPLDPDVAAQRAFDEYQKHRCMYGVFQAIAGATAEQLGPPYVDFPFEMFRFGEGGINQWATVCGALSGSAAAFHLFSPKPDVLIDALFHWGESEMLPNVYPKGAKFKEFRSVATTPLCHLSVSNWCKVSGKKAYSPERSERCACVTASAARKAVLLLNDQMAGKPINAALSSTTQSCRSCHERDGVIENTRGKMSCSACHEPLVKNHPTKKN